MTHAAHPGHPLMPYGAPELKTVAGAHLACGTSTSALLWVLVFLVAVAVVRGVPPGTTDPAPVFLRSGPTVLPAPPPLPMPIVAPAAAPSPPSHKAAASVPVPVPDAGAPEAFPGAGESDPIPGSSGAVGTPPPTAVAEPGTEQVPERGTFVPTDEPPVLVRQVDPTYPELAREAGVEGTVVVEALVGRDGRVRRTHVATSVPLLDESAEAAVRQWVFQPALCRSRPVAVWVSVRVRYRLH